MIDSHTHLTEGAMGSDPIGVVQDFVDVGGLGLVTQSMNRETFAKNIQIVGDVEELDLNCVVKTTRGYHPYEIVQGNLSPAELAGIHDEGARMIDMYDHEVVAVGECGIDLHYKDASKTLQTQQSVLAEHCRLALGYDLPVVVHSRDAFAETMDVLMDYPDLVVYMHCRGYGPDEMVEFLTHCPRAYVGFCGNITYKNAQNLRDSLCEVPLDRLLIETDAPYLSAQAVRGQENHPALITHTYDFVAQELDIDVADLQSQVTKNFWTLYHL